MFCMQCGTKLDDAAKFCYQCGSPTGVSQPQPSAGAAPAVTVMSVDDSQTVLAQPAQQPPAPAPQPSEPAQPSVQQVPQPEYPSAQYAQTAVKTKASSVRRNVIILVVVLVLLVAGAVTALFATGMIGGNNPDKILATAERYLDEKDYKEAIIQFEKLLEIDSMNVDAYLGLAEAYEAQGDIDKAIEVLEDALKELEDEKDIKKVEKALDKLLKKVEQDDDKDDEKEDKDDVVTAEAVVTTTAAPVVSVPEPVLFDISKVDDRWCTDTVYYADVSGATVMNVTVTSDEVSIKKYDDSVVYTENQWFLTEYGFVIDDGSDKYTFEYDQYSDILTMEHSSSYSNSVYHMSRGSLVVENTGSMVDVADDGKVLNIWCWNDEFQRRIAEFYPGYADNGDGTGRIGDVTVKWTINHNADNGYQIPLDAVLKDQDNKPADEKIDIFLIEADYADKYVNSIYSLPVSSLGITDADTAEMYRYTKEIATDASGALKAVSWQATPGVFAYKRSIAKDVLGTDDPTVVQQFVANWDKFDETAALMKDKGYYMLSGYYDAYRAFSDNVSAPWINDAKEIVIDKNLLRWVEQTKTYTDNGYNNKHSLWSEGWAADQGPDGKVFGFFYPTWGVNFTLFGNAGEDGFGDWAVCYGPDVFYWGGTWICAGYQTDNKTLVHDIMYNMTCNAEIMEKMTRDSDAQDFTNNMEAMEAIAADPHYKSDFLGGQNHVALFVENAKTIDMSNVSPYDQGLDDVFQAELKDYFDGLIDFDTALDNFYDSALTTYPELRRPTD